jgi:hypothetical protein
VYQSAARAWQSARGTWSPRPSARHDAAVTGKLAGLGGNGPQCTVDQPLHENLDAVAGNGELTSEACGTAEDDGVECED